MTATEVVVGIVIGLVVSAVVLLLIYRFFPPKREDTGDRLIGPIPRDVWEPAAATAKARGDNLRDVTVRALREYGREGQ